MKKRKREINVFSISMMDVIASAMGTFLIIMVVLLPYYKSDYHDIVAQNLEQQQQLDDQHTRIDGLEQQNTVLQQENTAQEVRIRELEQQNADAQQGHAAQQRRIDELERQHESLEQNNGELHQHNNDLQRRVADLETQNQELQEEVKKLGFRLKGKKAIVFVVDISKSMMYDNKIHDVVAGLKMLIATMDETYYADIVFFPDIHNRKNCFSLISQDYGCLWSGLQQMDLERKYEAYNFLSALAPDGATPTKSVMNFVLTNYDEAGTIFLLSDGVPYEGGRELDRRELRELVEQITTKNGGQKIINTVGVGKAFRDRNSSADAVWFLRGLAEKNEGFYVGY